MAFSKYKSKSEMNETFAKLCTTVRLSSLLDIAHTMLVFKGFAIYVIMLSGKQRIKSPQSVV